METGWYCKLIKGVSSRFFLFTANVERAIMFPDSIPWETIPETNYILVCKSLTLYLEYGIRLIHLRKGFVFGMPGKKVV